MTREELIEKMARAIHETMSAQAVIEYLDNPFDASAIAQAVLTAIEAAGLCIVPVEATAEMQAAGRDALLPYVSRLDRPIDDQWHLARLTYSAMIEAGRI